MINEEWLKARRRREKKSLTKMIGWNDWAESQKTFLSKMIEEMIATPHMVFWYLSIVLPVNLLI